MSNADFKRNFSRLLEKAGDKAELVVRKVAFDLSASLIMKSPVGNPDLWVNPDDYKEGWFKTTLQNAREGYAGGTFRGNWNLALNQQDTSTTEEIDPTGAAASARAFAKIAQYQPGQTIYITNSLPYAMRLEYGWSTKQAPQGMVRITVEEFSQKFRKAVNEVKNT